MGRNAFWLVAFLFILVAFQLRPSPGEPRRDPPRSPERWMETRLLRGKR